MINESNSNHQDQEGDLQAVKSHQKFRNNLSYSEAYEKLIRAINQEKRDNLDEKNEEKQVLSTRRLNRIFLNFLKKPAKIDPDHNPEDHFPKKFSIDSTSRIVFKPGSRRKRVTPLEAAMEAKSLFDKGAATQNHYLSSRRRSEAEADFGHNEEESINDRPTAAKENSGGDPLRLQPFNNGKNGKNIERGRRSRFRLPRGVSMKRIRKGVK